LTDGLDSLIAAIHGGLTRTSSALPALRRGPYSHSMVNGFQFAL
jgi:hypothetical protein